MKLIIGLGNPEKRYENTRHNVGFQVLSEYAGAKGAEFKLKEKFKACIAEISVKNEKVLLVKPTTYYNNVGEAAHLIADFYKIPPQDLLIIHDELALPFGTIRTRIGGSDAGNNGIKSIISHIGPGTARIRIGISNELHNRINDADFVLSNFTAEESEALTDITKKAVNNVDDFITDSFTITTH